MVWAFKRNSPRSGTLGACRVGERLPNYMSKLPFNSDFKSDRLLGRFVSSLIAARPIRRYSYERWKCSKH
jgi:hypothetical protein